MATAVYLSLSSQIDLTANESTHLKTQPSNPSPLTLNPDKILDIHCSFRNSILVIFAPKIRLPKQQNK